MRASPLYFRNFVFGVEDSLVSTVGLLSGVAISGMPRESIFLTGVVLILVEAFSMAAGSFLAESSAREYTHRTRESGAPVLGGVIMFGSYFISGFIPLAPYLLIEGIHALYVSVLVSCAALFLLGSVSGSLSNTGLFKRGLRMMLVGGVAIAAGMLAGLFLSSY